MTVRIVLLGGALMAVAQPYTPSIADRVADRVFDEYGNIRWIDEQSHLDNFAIMLQQDSNLLGYITVYAGRHSCDGEAQARAIRAKNYLVRRRGIERSRILWIDAGYQDNFLVVLQPADRGANIPFPIYPSLSSKDVQVVKCNTDRHSRNRPLKRA